MYIYPHIVIASICPSPKPLDEIQPNLVCELLTKMGCTTVLFLHHPLWPGEGSKGQISINFNHQATAKIFIPNLVCVHTNKRYKTYRTGFPFCHLVHPLGVGLVGAWGVKSLILTVRLSIMLSLSKPLDEIHPNLVCIWTGRIQSSLSEVCLLY